MSILENLTPKPKGLLCPKCKKTAMKDEIKNGVVANICPECGGHWYDLNELQAFVKDKNLLTQYLSKPLIKERPAERKCPRCHVDMLNGGLVSEFLRVDRCPKCNGIWLDQSELRILTTTLGLGEAK